MASLGKVPAKASPAFLANQTVARAFIPKYAETQLANMAPPNIMEFVFSPDYLGKWVYPRQATLLKCMFLQDGLFTAYDHEVIAEWTESFRRTGTNGIQPDILRRIEICKAEGRPWFREVLAVIGRRGSKGYIGGIAGAYVLLTFLSFENPQKHFGIDINKRLTAMVFATKREQAKVNQWRDLVDVIMDSPCFDVGRSQAETMTVRAPADEERIARLRERGIVTEMDPSTFEIVAKESTSTAGRGPASFMLMFDEFAHMVESIGGSRSGGEIYESSVPSLDQFGVYGFIYGPSSPWQKIGKFFERYELALQTEEDGSPSYPEMMMSQLASWDLYKDWERAHEINVLPDDMVTVARDEPRLALKAPQGRSWNQFPQVNIPVQTYDEQMQRLERANPETFRVERRSHFATVVDAYLNEKRVDDVFGEWKGAPLVMQRDGKLNTTYYAHGDPSKSGANFGFAMAHIEMDTEGMRHVVFDHLGAWMGADFPANNYEIDYIQVEEELKGWMDRFMPAEMSFDQFNSIGIIQRLRQYALGRRYPKGVSVFERTFTRTENYAWAETAKTAINMGFVHAPYFELAEMELKFLQDLGGKVDHPTSGPVQTKDVADCMMILIWALIGDQVASIVGEMLGGQQMHVGMQGGMRPFPEADVQDNSIHQQMSASGRASAARAGGRRLNDDGTFRRDSRGGRGGRGGQGGLPPWVR